MTRSHLSHWAWNSRIPQIQIGLLHTLTHTLKLTVKGGEERNFTTKEMISIFSLWTFHLYVPTFQQHLHIEYTSLSCRYSRVCGSYQDFPNRGLLLTRKLLNQGFLLVKLKSSLRTFYGRHHDLVDAMEYLCHEWPRICSTCRRHFPILSSFMTYHRVCN